jgi:hypothetical protein
MLMIGYFKVTTAEWITKKCTGGENKIKGPGAACRAPTVGHVRPYKKKAPVMMTEAV